MTNLNTHVLELFTHDKSMQSPLAKRVERPIWGVIEQALNDIFLYGGYARLDVLSPDDSYIKQLCMESLPGQFRIIVLTRDNNPKNEILEWWEPETTKFRGTIYFGDDEWDARMVCSNLPVGYVLFHELYEHGNFSNVSLLGLRSQWDPMPQ